MSNTTSSTRITSLLSALLIVSLAGAVFGDIYPPGDIDENHVVDFRDIEDFAAKWLDESCAAIPGCAADLNGADGVDGVDFAILARNWLTRGTTLVISEFMAGNGSSLPLEDWELLDEDGASSDWIEIFNPTDIPISLANWYLTDDANDLTKWRFPAGETLSPGQFMLVFASGKNRATTGAELHTNFQLDADEPDYLGLIEADGRTVAHEYSPRYPKQIANISYGLAQYATTFVSAGTNASYRVANADDYWYEPTYNDLSWQRDPTGFGFGNASPGFSITHYQAIIDVGDLTTAEQVVAESALYNQKITETASVINYNNTNGDGHYANDNPFPGTVIGNDVDNFVVVATGMVAIPSTGNWTFGVGSDDGFGLELSRGGDTFTSSYPNPRGMQDTLVTFNITQPGMYDLRLIYYERGGGSGLEFFAAQGGYSSFNASVFDLVGDTANGGLAISSFGSSVATDVQSLMQGINASLQTRIEFQAEEVDFYDSLSLRMQYDDGFVAYLNGVEVARSNFTGSPAFNSAADANRPNEWTIIADTFELSSHLGLLREGRNVLAVQGLNESASDGAFMVSPELIAASNQTVAQYLAKATPGGFNTSGSVDRVADTQFSHDRGFYQNSFDVTITCETDGATIVYTTDGSAPSDSHGSIYTGPVPIDTTTCVRAMAMRAGWMSTNIDTQTYIFLDDVIRQPSNPTGAPTSWGDYEMDPAVVNDPAYSGEIVNDLLELPTMSIVMNFDDLFSSSRGIYANAGSSGAAWERPCSVELFYPDGATGFQVDCGVRIYGGVGRGRPKKTFRLLFKRQYGPTKLHYNLFDNGSVDEFDTLILRAGFNNSWAGNYDWGPQYIRDTWMCNSQLAMGKPGLHGTFVHLYVNGLYWGLYNPVERCNADFGTSYFGGEKEEYDALNSYPRKIVDGVDTAWIAAQNLAGAGVADDIGYAAMAEYVDIENLIDYMILNFYGGNSDWDDHNWYTVRRRLPGEGWKFISWDAERTLESTTGANRTGVNQHNKPSYLHAALKANAEYKMRFADRARVHFFHGGALTPENTKARYEELADLIYGPIVCESARWGNTVRTSNSYTRNANWIPERDRLLTDYFPRRTDVVLGMLRSAGMYPQTDAPEFYVAGSPQYGGQMFPGDTLSMVAPAGTIYYTTDGNDPRAPVEIETSGATLVPENAVKRATVPTAAIGTSWRTDFNFNDALWQPGGTSNGALSFDGMDDYVATNKTASALGIGGSHVKTITAWAYTRTFNEGGIFEMGTYETERDFSLRTYTGDNSWRAQVWGNDVDFTYDSKDKWVHFAMVFDGARLKIYADGQLVGDELRAINTADNNPFVIGRWQTSYFDGVIDDVRIYNTALNVTAVQTLASSGDYTSGQVAHYKLNDGGGDIAIDSAGPHDGTLYGSPAWVDSDRDGPAGVGFETNPTDGTNYVHLIGIDLEAQMVGENTTCYVRIPFSVEAEELAGFNYMELQMRYDDGFIAYINGVKVHSENINSPDSAVWNSRADNSHGDGEAINLIGFPISSFLHLLQPGDNLLAIHGLNVSDTSSDVIISAKLIAGESSAPSSFVTSTAVEYTAPLTLAESTYVRARAFDGGVWSAVSQAGFSDGPVANYLRITEIMYHPRETGDPNDPNTEYIELKNIGGAAINLNLVSFTNGIDYTFGSKELSPGEYVLVVKDIDAFEGKYGSGVNIAGEYLGSLDNGGERVVLVDASGLEIHNFQYKDGWYGITDGRDFSLTVLDPTNADPNSWSIKESWGPSALPGGSPGFDDTGAIPAPGSIVINEVLAHSHDTLPDWIELHNITDAAINIGGWFLSDSDADDPNRMKFRIADGTSIDANGYVVFFEDLDFGVGGAGALVPFALSENGEQVVLHSGFGDMVTGYRDVEDFDASPTGVSFGRHYKASTDTYNFVMMSDVTPGWENAYPVVGPIVINEIMYNPLAGNQDWEYIELHNITSSPIALKDPDSGLGWRFSDGITLDIPPSPLVTIPANGYLMVVKNGVEFVDRYGGMPAGVQILEYDSGNLDNGGEKLELSRPGDVDTLGDRYWIRVDRVNYSDGSHPAVGDPWPTGPDGNGWSLSRIEPEDYGNDVANWESAVPSPGQANP